MSSHEAPREVEPPLMELRGVWRTYGAGDATVNALGGVDLTIRDGEFVAVVGASGSGKSTCMNILGCLDRPTAGAFRFRGVELRHAGADELALIRRHYIGFVFQGYNLLSRTSALENVELPLVYRRVPSTERRERALSALRAVGLEGRERHAPSELSGGQQQRVAIARAIVTSPLLILADEPTGNLDSVRSREILRLLVDLNQRNGVTVVLVTHEAAIAEWARRIVRFADGLIANDTPNEAREA